MASIQEPAVQLAQRLASNEKPVRTKAVKKLRIYINVRSHVAEGGFAGDELLKLWKGLFYCLWMQDKPLLQEELSKQISTLIHSFQDIDGQLLYLESFLQTFKREWTGIDRLRMDKFFQLVRFMFRETFKILKRNNWESCVVARFLELLTAQLLQSSSGAPSGLQYHVLDLYMTELAAVGSAELTADQNLIFIEPFCKTAAKTKDRALFSAICNSMLSTIIDQAPFAIEDLMKELKAADTSDSGQASEEDDGELQGTEKQLNGSVSNNEEEEEDVEEEDAGDDDDEEEDLPESCDEDIGPVLQFDYTALADKLFALASRRGTPSRNRQRLYKIIKVLRDLNEGIFPQDEYPEEVSTDEDDDMFGSRKRIKRGRGRMGETDEREPAAKNSKGKKTKTCTLNKQNEESGKDNNEPADLTKHDENKRKKKKTGQGGHADGEGNADRSEQEQTLAQAENVIQENKGSLEGPKAEDLEKEVVTQSTLSTVKVTEAAPPEGRSETLLLSEVKKIPTVIVAEETSQPAPCTGDDEHGSEQLSKKGNLKSEVTEEQQPPVKEPGVGATASGKKKRRTKQTHEVVAESQVNTTAKNVPATTLTKKKKKGRKFENNLNEVEVNGVSKEAGVPSTCEDSEEGGPTDGVEKPTILSNKKTKKNNLEADEGATVEAKDQSEVEEKPADTDVTSGGKEASLDAAAVPLKKRKGKQRDATLEESPVVPLNKKRKKTLKESKTSVEEEGVAVKSPRGVDAETEITMATPTKKKKKKIAAVKEQTQETQEVSSCRKATKKKRKIPVVFEYEDDELEAVAWKTTLTNGLTQVHTKPDSYSGEPSTPLHTKKCKKALKTSSGAGSDDFSFQSNATVPTPLYCKTPGSCSKKKIQTPKSESKKVTFGLKNNKTAEFRKTDRSLLVTPDGPSRVPFDPEQKPKFGVLKSTPTRLPASKTPKAKKIGMMRSTPKRRPSAADFF